MESLLITCGLVLTSVTTGGKEETEQAAQDIALAINQHDALVAQLNVLHKLICEGSVSGFNPHEGDWAEKLFMSQNTTHHLLKENLGEE